jgi:hypothetical protein
LARPTTLHERSQDLLARSNRLRRQALTACGEARLRVQELARIRAAWSAVDSAAPASQSPILDLDRSDVRRVLALLGDYPRIEVRPGEDGTGRRAAVRLSRFRGDEVPLGLDVLEILEQAGYVQAARRRGSSLWYGLTGAGSSAAGRVRVPSGRPPGHG